MFGHFGDERVDFDICEVEDGEGPTILKGVISNLTSILMKSMMHTMIVFSMP